MHIKICMNAAIRHWPDVLDKKRLVLLALHRLQNLSQVSCGRMYKYAALSLCDSNLRYFGGCKTLHVSVSINIYIYIAGLSSRLDRRAAIYLLQLTISKIKRES